MLPRSRAPLAASFELSAASPQLTARQRQILDWIRGHLESAGRPPTRAEIAAGLGFSTPSSAEDHLRALEKKGVLEIEPGAARGLRLKNLPGIPVQGILPLVGRVAAGAPLLATEHIEAHYRGYPLDWTIRAWEMAGMRGVQTRIMSLGGGLVMWGQKADG